MDVAVAETAGRLLTANTEHPTLGPMQFSAWLGRYQSVCLIGKWKFVVV